ncbi:MAG: hypothetical protein RBR69_03845 [Candidatus Cloacimonadaceae bacterium]|jgi:uncharacterized membrane protein (DUF485 family)|nr:hypothetical protein [Candidatus Cloacimonadota bacterium]MDY0127244.1 hypothetical protein [Candidatus Cloacimonadaceae bacterium]MCB5254519.1 hypothetical protein [Candidatus Cloacimonadota bacterium]MCK9178272.1 hypothetical protein [Candidatus Cloacimonadota bacterium]MCK9242852.1 hypothetical protein [Candidatus Cloacimonadota bacterium]
MKDTFFKVKQIAWLVLFIAVLSVMGMITGRPIMMLVYAGFFLLMSFIVYLTLRKNQRHFEVVSKSNKNLRIIVAAILMLLAIIAPMLIALRSSVINLPESLTPGAVVSIMLGITLVFIALVLLAVYQINIKGYSLTNRIIGYISFLIAAMLPGILMSNVDRSTMGIGSVYYVAMAVLILAYNARNLFCHQD